MYIVSRETLRIRKLPILILALLVLGLCLPATSLVKAQELTWRREGHTIIVTGPDFEVHFVDYGALTGLWVGGYQILRSLSFCPRGPQREWVGDNTYWGDIIESTVKELPGGALRVILRTQVPKDDAEAKQMYFTFEFVYTVYPSGMIMLNMSTKAYKESRSARQYTGITIPVQTFAGGKAYAVYGGATSALDCPVEYERGELASGTFSAFYTVFKDISLVIIALDPPSLGYGWWDCRDWDDPSYGMFIDWNWPMPAPEGFEWHAALLIWAHTMGKAVTEKLVSAFGNLGAAKSMLEALHKRSLRTPGGKKYLSAAETEVKLAYDALRKGDYDGMYTHASRAMDVINQILTVERNQRILLYMVIPGIIAVAIVTFSLKSCLSKPE